MHRGGSPKATDRAVPAGYSIASSFFTVLHADALPALHSARSWAGDLPLAPDEQAATVAIRQSARILVMARF